MNALHLPLASTGLKICTRCIYDERTASISFDQSGVCNYCRQIDRLTAEYGTGTESGKVKLDSIIDEIKRTGAGNATTASSGSAAELTRHTWSTSRGNGDCGRWRFTTTIPGIPQFPPEHPQGSLGSRHRSLHARSRQQGIGRHLQGVLHGGVAEIDAATDLALAETLYRAASKYGVKYVLEGHSFITEGITPIGRNYFDGKYIQSIHSPFGRLAMKTYPLMTFSRFLWWSCGARIRKIRPFWYIPYSKEEARRYLQDQFGWQYYGGHHLENRMTAFFHGIYAPQKFHSDFRNNTLSALVRNGKMSREAALAEYAAPPLVEDDLLAYFKKRLGLSDQEYSRLMDAPPKSWRDFPTYKRRFERLRPLFYVLAKRNLVPMSFYLKYCLPAPP